MNYSNKRGSLTLIQIIIVLVIIILVLSVFGVNIQSVVESPQVEKNFSYITGFFVKIWNNYLSYPFLYLWNDIFIDLLWEPFVSNLKRIRENQPTDFELMAPAIPDINLKGVEKLLNQ